jgi:flagellar basal-body rod protein FlgB
MDPTAIPLFALADRRLAWLDQRLSTLAGNVANADTPGYRPTDMAPFAATVGAVGAALAPARTDPGHLSGTPSGRARQVAALDGERGPDGNGVSLDTEMLRIAETDASHELVGEVYRKYVGMFRTAAGR